MIVPLQPWLPESDLHPTTRRLLNHVIEADYSSLACGIRMKQDIYRFD